MQDEKEALRKRFSELCDRAELRRAPVFSDFLDMHEQSILQETRFSSSVFLCGGYDTAERRIACFGFSEPPEAEELPAQWLCIKPAAQKFADALTHRDFLGALLSLGLRREMIGDIVVTENCGYVFCMQTVVSCVLSELSRVKHTTVRCSVAKSLPLDAVRPPEYGEFVVSGTRLDALCAAVFRLSRSDAQKRIAAGRVFVNSREITKSDFLPQDGDIISVRGVGRFVFGGIARETKKGKLRILAGLYA